MRSPRSSGRPLEPLRACTSSGVSHDPEALDTSLRRRFLQTRSTGASTACPLARLLLPLLILVIVVLPGCGPSTTPPPPSGPCTPGTVCSALVVPDCTTPPGLSIRRRRPSPFKPCRTPLSPPQMEDSSGEWQRQRDRRVSVPHSDRCPGGPRRSSTLAGARLQQPRRQWASRRRVAARRLVRDQPLRQDLCHRGLRRRRQLQR